MFENLFTGGQKASVGAKAKVPPATKPVDMFSGLFDKGKTAAAPVTPAPPAPADNQISIPETGYGAAIDYFPSTMQALDELQLDPWSIHKSPKDALNDAAKTFKDAIAASNVSKEDFQKATTTPAKIGAGMKYAAAQGGLLFSPITALFSAANDVPLLGTASKLIGGAFGLLGDEGRFTAYQVVNALPISKEAKDSVVEGASDISSLAFQIAGGAAVGSAIKASLPSERAAAAFRADFVKDNPDMAADVKKVDTNKINSLVKKHGAEDAGTIVREAIAKAKGGAVPVAQPSTAKPEAAKPAVAKPTVTTDTEINQLLKTLFPDQAEPGIAKPGAEEPAPPAAAPFKMDTGEPAYVQVPKERMAWGEYDQKTGKTAKEGDITAAYSGDKITTGKIKKPVTLNGKQYTNIGGVMGKKVGLVEVIPADQWPADQPKYDYGKSPEGMQYTYYGTKVKYGGKDFVLGNAISVGTDAPETTPPVTAADVPSPAAAAEFTDEAPMTEKEASAWEDQQTEWYKGVRKGTKKPGVKPGAVQVYRKGQSIIYDGQPAKITEVTDRRAQGGSVDYRLKLENGKSEYVTDTYLAEHVAPAQAGSVAISASDKGIPSITSIKSEAGRSPAETQVPSGVKTSPAIVSGSTRNISSPTRTNFLKSFGIGFNDYLKDPTSFNSILARYRGLVNIVRDKFVNATSDISGKFGDGYLFREKTDKSILTKLERRVGSKRGNTLGEVDDMLASTAVVPADNMDAAVKYAQDNYNITKVDDFRAKPTFLGYRAVHMDYELPTGQVGEIQVNTPEGIYQKNYAHLIYDKWRKWIEFNGVATFDAVRQRIVLDKGEPAALEFAKDVEKSRAIYNGDVKVPQEHIDDVNGRMVRNKAEARKLTLAPTKAATPKAIEKEATKIWGKEKQGMSRYPATLKPFADVAQYQRPMIGKTELKTLLANSPEFRDNPVLTVNADKELQFDGKTSSFIVKSGAMQLNMDKLNVGDQVTVDPETLKGQGGIQQMRISGPEGELGFINVGGAVEDIKAQLAKVKAGSEAAKYGEKLRGYLVGQRDERIAGTNQLRDKLAKIITPKEREALTFYRDFKGNPVGLADLAADPDFERYRPIIKLAMSPTDGMLKADDAVTRYYQGTLAEGRQLGFLDSGIPDENYITHLLAPAEDTSKAPKKGFGGRRTVSRTTPFAKGRYYETVADAIKGGARVKTLDSLDALTIYGEKHAVAASTKLLLQELKQSKLGKYGFAGSDNVPHNWVPLDPSNRYFRNIIPFVSAEGNPTFAYQDLYVPQIVSDAMKPIVAGDFTGQVPGFSKMRLYQSYLKTIQLGLSVFHIRALNLTALNNAGLTDFVKSYASDMESEGFLSQERDFVGHGGQSPILGRTIEAYKGLSDSSLPSRAELLRKIPGVKQVDDFAKGLTKMTFDIMQRKFKVQDYSLKVARWISQHPNSSEGDLAEAKRVISKEVNASYGGLNWEVLGWSKASLNVARFLMLAPDWTFSNIFNAKYAFEGGPSGSAARKFWIRSAITGAALTYGTSTLLTGKPPAPNFQNFTNISMGKDKYGKDIYQNLYFAGAPNDAINLFNNIADYGIIQGFAQSVAAKASPAIRTSIQMLTNRNYLGQAVVPKGAGPIAGTGRAIASYGASLSPVPFTLSTFASMFYDPKQQYTWPEFISALAGTRPRHVVPPGMRQVTSGKKKGQLVPLTPAELNKQKRPLLEQIQTGKTFEPIKKP
jgi:hypothetical protein